MSNHLKLKFFISVLSSVSFFSCRTSELSSQKQSDSDNSKSQTLPFKFHCSNSAEKAPKPGVFVLRSNKTFQGQDGLDFFKVPILGELHSPPVAFGVIKSVLNSEVLLVTAKQINNGILLGDLELNIQTKKASWKMRNPQGGIPAQIFMLDFCDGDY